METGVLWHSPRPVLIDNADAPSCWEGCPAVEDASLWQCASEACHPVQHQAGHAVWAGDQHPCTREPTRCGPDYIPRLCHFEFIFHGGIHESWWRAWGSSLYGIPRSVLFLRWRATSLSRLWRFPFRRGATGLVQGTANDGDEAQRRSVRLQHRQQKLVPRWVTKASGLVHQVQWRLFRR